MKKTAGEEPGMWGKGIDGFGINLSRGKWSREGDWFVTGFSPRKQNMTVYRCPGFRHLASQTKGPVKFKTGAGCLYFKKVSDTELAVLNKMLLTNKKIPGNLKQLNKTK